MIEPTWTSECGTVKLWNADCLAVMATWPDGAVDCVVTDPPYGIGERLVKGGAGHSFDNLINSGADKWDVKPESGLLRYVIGLSTCCIIWGGNFHELPPCDKPLCWDKIRPNQKNLSEWEYAWTSMTGRAEMFRYCANGGFVARENREHPTQKPESLMIWCLRFAPDGLVADPFMGSGTTGVAAVRLGRSFWGVELKPEYFAIAKRRIQEELASRDFLEPHRPREQQAEMFGET